MRMLERPKFEVERRNVTLAIHVSSTGVACAMGTAATMMSRSRTETILHIAHIPSGGARRAWQ
jgi:hypothetical protein